MSKYSVVADNGMHYGIDASSPLDAKLKAESKGKRVTGIFSNSNDGENTPSGENLLASNENWIMPNMAAAIDDKASTLKKIGAGIFDVASFPLRGAASGYKALGQGVGSALGLGADVPTEESVKQSMEGNDPSENIISIEAQNPVNYIPGFGEARGIELLGKGIKEVAPKAVKIAMQYPKVVKASNLLKSMATGALNGATTGIANQGVNAVVADPRETNIGASIAQGALLNPTMQKAGSLLSGFGKRRMSEAIKINPSTQVNSANPPELEDIIAYNNPISGKHENLAPYNGDNAKLSESVSSKINQLHTAQKPLVERMAESNASSTNMDDAFQQTMDYAKEMHKSGKYVNEAYARAKSLLSDLHNTVKTQNAIRYATPEQENSIYSLLDKGQPLDDGIVNSSTKSVPFDIAYNTRKSVDDAVKWSNIKNPKSHPVDEDILHKLRTNINDNLKPNIESATPQSLKDYAEFQKLQKAYSELLPWDRPLKQAAARTGNNRGLGIMEMIPLSAGIAHAASGGGPEGFASGAALAGIAHLAKNPGTGSAMYDAGKLLSKSPMALQRNIISDVSTYPKQNKYAPSQFAFKKQENK